MLVLGGLEVGLTPLLSYMAEERLALTVPMGYLAQAIAVLAPFLMLGAVAYAMCYSGFLASLPFFGIYTAIRVLMQFPLAIYEYSESLSSPYLFVLFVYILTSLLNIAVFFLLLLLGYLLFARGKNGHDERFFGCKGADTRILWLCVAAIAVQDIGVFIVEFIEHLKGKLWLFDGGDFTDILISLFFILFCAILSFTAGRFAMKAFYPPYKTE